MVLVDGGDVVGARDGATEHAEEEVVGLQILVGDLAFVYNGPMDQVEIPSLRPIAANDAKSKLLAAAPLAKTASTFSTTAAPAAQRADEVKRTVETKRAIVSEKHTEKKGVKHAATHATPSQRTPTSTKQSALPKSLF